MPLSDLPSVKEHSVTCGRHVLPLVGVAALEPGDIVGVVDASLLGVPLDVVQENDPARALPQYYLRCLRSQQL